MSYDAEDNSFTVSVIIPAYNAAEHIGRAIDSILTQTRLPDEIIVVDDGSTDSTPQIATAYGEKVTLIQQQNAGVSAARNTGIKAARCEWIAFLDADDEWLPEKLEKQSALLKRNPELVWAYSNFRQADTTEGNAPLAHNANRATKLLAGKEYFDDYFDAEEKGIVNWTGTVIIRKNVLMESQLFATDMLASEDTDMWWQIAHKWPAVGYLIEPDAVYHTGIDQSLSKQYSNPSVRIDLIERHLKMAADSGRTEPFEKCTRHYLCYWIQQSMRSGQKRDALKIINRFKSLLPTRFKTEIRIRVLLPFIGPAIVNLYFAVKKKLK
jgi:glycosyltransferase involved in cell wall biosynthesis